MKKIALFSTFCDTPEKVRVITENARILRSLGVDVMVNSPIHLDSDVVQEFDFYFKNKENPVLTWPDRVHTAWRTQTNKLGQIIRISRGMREYGWAALYQIKKLSEIALGYDYDIFYHMNYDILLDDELQDEILSESRNKIYPVRDERTPGHVWQGSPLLSSFDRENLQKISEDITKERYKGGYSIAEDFVFSWIEKFGLTQSSYHAKDQISIGNDSEIFSEVKEKDILDYSKNPEYKFFWNKEEGNLKFVLWNFEESRNISVSINGFIFKGIENLIPVVTEIHCKDIHEISVIVEDSITDYLKEYQDTIVNWINVD
jgi:hypothetical protein